MKLNEIIRSRKSSKSWIRNRGENYGIEKNHFQRKVREKGKEKVVMRAVVECKNN